MIFLSSTAQLKKDLQAFEAGLLDPSGKVKLENLPSNYIQNTFEVATKAGLTSLLTADKNDIAFVADEDTNYRLKTNDPTNLANWIEQPFIVQQGTPPVGYSYTRTPGAKLPGDTLQDFTGADITTNYDPADLAVCHHPGTVWKLAIRPGDFLRQIGGNGGASVGDTQEDQFQGHTQKIIWDISTPDNYVLGQADGSTYSGAYRNAVPTAGTGNHAFTTQPVFHSDGTNGTPRTGNETRPVNTAGEYWVRVA